MTGSRPQPALRSVVGALSVAVAGVTGLVVGFALLLSCSHCSGRESFVQGLLALGAVAAGGAAAAIGWRAATRSWRWWAVWGAAMVAVLVAIAQVPGSGP